MDPAPAKPNPTRPGPARPSRSLYLLLRTQHSPSCHFRPRRDETRRDSSCSLHCSTAVSRLPNLPPPPPPHPHGARRRSGRGRRREGGGDREGLPRPPPRLQEAGRVSAPALSLPFPLPPPSLSQAVVGSPARDGLVYAGAASRVRSCVFGCLPRVAPGRLLAVALGFFGGGSWCTLAGGLVSAFWVSNRGGVYGLVGCFQSSILVRDSSAAAGGRQGCEGEARGSDADS